MNPLSLTALAFALIVGAAVGFAGGHAICDGGTTIIKRQDRLEATP